MRLDITRRMSDETVFTVTLSRKNLRTLLHKLDISESARTITGRYVFIEGEIAPAEIGMLVVRAEENESHYLGRDETAGTMSLETERFLRRQVH